MQWKIDSLARDSKSSLSQSRDSGPSNDDRASVARALGVEGLSLRTSLIPIYVGQITVSLVVLCTMGRLYEHNVNLYFLCHASHMSIVEVACLVVTRAH